MLLFAFCLHFKRPSGKHSLMDTIFLKFNEENLGEVENAMVGLLELVGKKIFQQTAKPF